METVYNTGEIRTVLTPADHTVLCRIIRLFGKLVEVELIGEYRTMTPNQVWLTLVGEVCVRGSARHMERLRSDPSRRAEFEGAVSLKAMNHERNVVSYLTNTFRDFCATRFPKRGAEYLATLLRFPAVFHKDRLVLFNQLSHKASAVQTRDELIKRCPIFRLKSASDFMISVGLSTLQKHLSYNLTPARIQSQRGLYLSLEVALRDFCNEQNISLALLNRILFKFSNMGAIDLIVKYPEVRSTLG